MLEVGRDDRQKDFRRVGEVLHEELDRWHELSTEGRSMTGTPSGFTDLDEITGGFQPGNMIIVAAARRWASRRWSRTSPRTSRCTPTGRGPSRCSASRCRSPSSRSASSPRRRRSRATTCARAASRTSASGSACCETAARYDKSPLFVDDSSDIGILEVRAKARRLHQQTWPSTAASG